MDTEHTEHTNQANQADQADQAPASDGAENMAETPQPQDPQAQDLQPQGPQPQERQAETSEVPVADVAAQPLASSASQVEAQVEAQAEPSPVATQEDTPQEAAHQDDDRLGGGAQEAEAEDAPIQWHQPSSKDFASNYSETERQALTEAYAETLQAIQEGETVEGIVTHMNDKYAVVSIGYKSDGLVHRSELRDLKPPVAVGDTLEVFIERQEDKLGNLIISHRKARIIRAWERIQASFENEEVLEGRVKRRTKGGLIVNIFDVEAFLPGSQIDVKPIRDFDAYVDKTIEVKVVKINHANDNVVVSHKVLIEKDIEQQRSVILNNLEKGQVLEGTVKNITNFGAFIDLGGIDGLLHITDIAWGRIGHPQEVLESEQKVNVVVLGFDDAKKRISLGMKQLQPHPWEITKDLEVGSRVKGKVVNITDYGAFMELVPGVEGLIHVSEMSWSQHLRNTNEFVKMGEEIEAVVLSIDNETHKLGLGLRQLHEDPWKRGDLLQRYAPGTRHTGTVRNMTNYGLFLELEEGIDGLVHVSDLSWTKKIRHPSDFIKADEKLEIVVLEIDPTNKRLSLSHRHLEPNPWEEFEAFFARGTTHKCTLLRSMEKVSILELPYGLEGICFPSHLQKEDKTQPEVGESLPFVVMDFSKEDKRIVLSHTLTYRKRTEHKGNKDESTTQSKSGSAHLRRAIKEVNQEVEKSTLGELSELSSLKAKLDGGTPDEADKDEADKKADD